jgi:hypothetical protein
MKQYRVTVKLFDGRNWSNHFPIEIGRVELLMDAIRMVDDALKPKQEIVFTMSCIKEDIPHD